MWMLTSLIALGSSAQAALVDVTVCAKYAVNYVDQPAPSDPEQVDFFKTNSDKRARGAWLAVRNASTQVIVEQKHTNWTNPDAGCFDVELDTNRTYEAQISAGASVDGNIVRVHYDDLDSVLIKTPWSVPFSPVGQGDTIEVVTGLHAGWNIAATTGRALSRSSVNFTGKTINLYDCVCRATGTTTNCVDDPTSGNCWKSSRNQGYINGDQYMFTVSHEFGHAVMDMANDGGTGSGFSNTSAVEDDCDSTLHNGSHAWNSKEYQSAAFVEGFAQYYSALTFNKPIEDDCTIWVGSIDWNISDTLEPDEYGTFSCEDGIPSVGVPDEDYYGAFCDLGATNVNRANEYDWCRTLWDMDSKGDPVSGTGVNLRDILDMVDGADPHSWQLTGNTVTVAHPIVRLYIGTTGVSPEMNSAFVSWAQDNGVYQ